MNKKSPNGRKVEYNKTVPVRSTRKVIVTLRRKVKAWINRQAIERFRASILSTADSFSLARDSEGIQLLIKEADQFALLHPVTRQLIKRLIEPNQWIGPWLGVPTITDLLNQYCFLTEIDLIRFHLGKRYHEVNRVVFDNQGTHLFAGEEEVICARGSHALLGESARDTVQRRFEMAARLHSQLTGSSVDHTNLVGMQRITYEKISKTSWRRSAEPMT